MGRWTRHREHWASWVEMQVAFFWWASTLQVGDWRELLRVHCTSFGARSRKRCHTQPHILEATHIRDSLAAAAALRCTQGTHSSC